MFKNSVSFSQQSSFCNKCSSLLCLCGCLYVHAQLFQTFATPWTEAHQASLSFTMSLSLLTLMSIESVMLSNYLTLCCPLLLPSIFSSLRVSSNELALLIRWQKYWSLIFSICPSNGYSGLISFRIDWFDLLVIQGTLQSLLQHTVQKQFFGSQLSLWSNSRICAWLLEKP